MDDDHRIPLQANLQFGGRRFGHQALPGQSPVGRRRHAGAFQGAIQVFAPQGLGDTLQRHLTGDIPILDGLTAHINWSDKFGLRDIPGHIGQIA